MFRADGAKERPLRIADQAGAVDVGGQGVFEIVVGGHGMILAALLVQPQPQPPILREHVLDLHTQAGADAREAVNHKRDQRPVPQPRRRRGVDRVQQRPRLGRLEHRGLA